MIKTMTLSEAIDMHLNLLKIVLYPNKDNTIRERQMLEMALEINSVTQIIKNYINFGRN